MMIMLMPLMLMMSLLTICADGSLPAMRWLKWLAEASPSATGKRMWTESRTGIGGRRVWEGMWNPLAGSLA